MQASKTVDARKQPQGADAARLLLDEVDQVFIGRGKKYAKLLSADLKESVEARKPMLGPTGNLRAPTLRLGRTLVVGYCEPMYDEVIGS
ncbi:MAG: hypothetical protein COA70_11175 [Planctomycetota bacterium]|nr:MAG: hypothetical protein COA70_11175 [Planctomycetota bacterium]